jgi:hypothetical protein
MKIFTVVSLDRFKLWGIEGDFQADNEDGAIQEAKRVVTELKIGDRLYPKAFEVGNGELEDFIKNNPFID